MPTSASTASTTSTTTVRSTDIDYGIDPWKVSLIDARARLRGYRRDELDDVRQDLAPIIAAFVFDAVKSNGASERTVLVSIIDNQLTMALRTRARWQRFRASYHAEALNAEASRINSREPADHLASDRRHDVAAAIQDLDPDDAAVARALMNGDPVLHIAQRMARSRYAIEQAIGRIRDRFASRGMRAWFEA